MLPSRLPLAADVPVGPLRGTPAAAYPAAFVRATLAPYLTPDRAEALARVAAARAFGVVPVLEGLTDPGNVNAVLRSAEGLGFGAAHLVGLGGDAAAIAAQYLDGAATDEPPVQDRRAARRASSGAHKWVELHAWRTPEAYLAWARDAGVRVAALALTPGARPIDTWDFTQPTALVVGNERDGVSAATLAGADAVLTLPLDGFVESYNVSVAAAMALAHARADRLRRAGRHGDLSDDEQALVVAHYMARAVPLAAPILAEAARRADDDPAAL